MYSPEDLTTWERSVDEETDSGIWENLTDEAGDEEQVVVVNPDQVAWLVDSLDSLSERLVHGSVRSPVFVCACIFGGNILP